MLLVKGFDNGIETVIYGKYDYQSHTSYTDSYRTYYGDNINNVVRLF